MLKYNVFISYSRSDLAIVEPFVKDVENTTGVTCWIDWTGIESGTQFEDIIIKAINDADIVLFMVSQASMESKYAKMEVNYAYNIGKKVIPIIIDGGELSGWFLFKFGAVDYIDIRNQRQIEKLKQNLITWCKPSLNDNQSGTSIVANGTYSIGDIYNDGKLKGVVFEVDSTGEHGKILHPDEAVLRWANKGSIAKVCLSKDDGIQNLGSIIQVDKWRDHFPAFAWCVEQGTDWYLPAIEELQLAIASADKLNPSLDQCGGVSLAVRGNMRAYWSSTQKTKGCSWIIDSFEGFKIDFPIDLACNVRAIAKF